MGSDDSDEAIAEKGRRVFLRVCNECHSYRGERTGTTRAPEMFGYASVDWIEAMIADPSKPTRFGNSGREPAQMPAFREKLNQHERRLIAEWLFQDGHQREGR